MSSFASAKATLAPIIDIVRPPKRISVTECAEKNIYLKGAAYTGYYKRSLSPLMAEPADTLTSRSHDSVILAATVQTGKTQSVILNGCVHKIIADPMDVMIVEKDITAAGDFSRRRIDRLLNESPNLKDLLVPGRSADTVYRKTFKSGQILNIGWPSKNQLAGKPIGFILGTDYDRWSEDIGGEGSGFDQMEKRITTYMSKGMCAVESTPSKEIDDPKWQPTEEHPHEAPPTKGILGLYNSGDRRMVYAKCPHCEEYFCPSPNPEVSLHLPEAATVEERAEKIGVICTGCGTIIDREYERQFKATAVWLKEGQTIDSEGVIHGEGRVSRRASFWLSGYFAAFNSWYDIGLTYARADDMYRLLGDEQALKNCYNQEFAYPYIAKSRRSKISDFALLKERAHKTKRFDVPKGVRTILTSVDVQAGKNSRFEFGVFGFGEQSKCWPMDRYALHEVERNGKTDRVQPGSHLEDWDVLNAKINATYKLGDDKELMNHFLVIDCGGEAGVYDNALDWFRQLEPSLKKKVYLVRGMGGKKVKKKIKEDADKVVLSWPDSRKQSNRKVSSKGDVPVLMINTDRFKDDLMGRLERDFEGWGYVTFPKYFKDEHFDELLNSEVREPHGWVPIRGKANETLDLFCYALAIWYYLGGQDINWELPPSWASEMDKNSNVVTSGVRRQSQSKKRPLRRVRSVVR